MTDTIIDRSIAEGLRRTGPRPTIAQMPAAAETAAVIAADGPEAQDLHFRAAVRKRDAGRGHHDHLIGHRLEQSGVPLTRKDKP